MERPRTQFWKGTLPSCEPTFERGRRLVFVLFCFVAAGDWFRIGATSGVLSTSGRPFDRERRRRHWVAVEARSERPGSGERARVAHTRVLVNVTDVNDNRPVFLDTPYYAVVAADAAKGAVVTQVGPHSLFDRPTRDLGGC